MKEGMKAAVLAVMVLAAGACGGVRENTACGVIVDATMNSVMIVSQAGDTLSFSTVDAERVGPDGILIGDTATVYFQGEVRPGQAVSVTKMVVSPTPRPEKLITGAWEQPILGLDGVQGVEIKGDGTAASINMSTLQYEKWALRGDKLILSGQSVGNGQTIDFSDTLRIEKISADSLVLLRGDAREAYARARE